MNRFVIAILLIATPVCFAADYPSAELKNDHIKMTIRLPDAAKGFYRSTRFDWSGVIGPVEVLGKTVFNPWKNTHNPLNNDDITGPCDEFNNTAPLNFKEAREGERFLKIGIGELTKGKDNEYAFWKRYAIAKPGTWRVKPDKSKVTFEQTVMTDFGFGYEYTKTVSLQQGAGFRIDHALKNTGTRRIDTDVYNHNFFNVAGASTGKGFQLTFPFSPKPTEPKERFTELVRANGKTLAFTGELDRGSIHTILEGYGKDASDAKFELQGGGITMNVTGDRPLSKVAFWGMKTTLCPEPYIAIKLDNGETMTWSWTYQFALAK